MNADLDNLLGFKGNYMLFPLLEHNALTRFMAAPFVDPVAGVRDPDLDGDVSVDDLAREICCLKERDPEAFEELRGEYLELYQQALEAAGRRDGEIVVPTDSLFIEALPGAHAVLEDFKLLWRRASAQPQTTSSSQTPSSWTGRSPTGF